MNILQIVEIVVDYILAPVMYIFVVIMIYGILFEIQDAPFMRLQSLGRLDRDGWTKHDYRLWYSEQWTNMFPVSDREVHILTIVQGYEKYGR